MEQGTDLSTTSRTRNAADPAGMRACAPCALVVGRFPPHGSPDADASVRQVLALASAGYAVETLALAGTGHQAARFDRAFGLRAMAEWLRGRHYDRIVIDPSSLTLRRPDSWSRLGVLVLQLTMLVRFLRHGRQVTLADGRIGAEGMLGLARVTEVLTRAFVHRQPPPAAPAAVAPPEAALVSGKDEAPRAWAQHFAELAALWSVVPSGGDGVAAMTAVSRQWCNAPPAWRRERLSRARSGSIAQARLAGLDRATRAALGAFEPDPAWLAVRMPSPAGVSGRPPLVARWMTHLAAEARAREPQGAPAPTPPVDCAPATAEIAAARLVSWAETTLLCRPDLAARRARLTACRSLLDGARRSVGDHHALGGCAVQLAGALPPLGAATRAAFWRHLLRSGGLQEPVTRRATRPASDCGGHRKCKNLQIARIDHLVGGGDPFTCPDLTTALASAHAPTPELPPAMVQGAASMHGQDEMPRIVCHGRTGGLDPLTRLLLSRLSRRQDDQPCALFGARRWRSQLHVMDLSASELVARVLDGCFRVEAPRAALVLLATADGGSQDVSSAPPCPVEALALTMVDAVWCPDAEGVRRLRARHPGLSVPIVALTEDQDGAGRNQAPAIVSHVPVGEDQVAPPHRLLARPPGLGVAHAAGEQRARSRSPAAATARAAVLLDALAMLDVAA